MEAKGNTYGEVGRGSLTGQNTTFVNTSNEQRTSVRTAADVPVTVQISGREVQARTANISEGGAFVACQDPPPVGTMVKLVLDFGDESVQAFSEVVWIRVRAAGSEQPAGMGLQFRHFPEEGRRALYLFLLKK